jgi:hypothetical protein
LWELAACVEGYNLANGGGDEQPAPLGVNEYDDLIARHAEIANSTKH